MRKIGIFRRVLPLRSEAFIKEQACNLMRYKPTFVSSTLLSEMPSENVSLSQNDLFGIKQIIFLLTRSPQLFQQLELKHLALLHAHFGPDGAYAMALADQLKIPLVVTFHGYDITISRKAIWRTGKFLYYQLLFNELELKRKASAFIAVSHFIRSKLLEKGYPEEKIIQHYIGVDTVKFSPTDNKADERYILCVGRHIQKKGIDTLLRAFAQVAQKHPSVSLIQIGAGPLTSELHALATELGIQNRVRFIGSQPHKVVLNLMRGAEIFALPSQTAKNGDCEGLPIVINEASACGVPVVSTFHSGIPEAVLNGKTGFLVTEKDDVALAEKLDTLLSDRALSEKMGRLGRKFVCEEFDIYKQTAKLEAIYDSLIYQL